MIESTTWTGNKIKFGDDFYMRLINADTKKCKYWYIKEGRFLNSKEVKIMENHHEKA